jgi:uncharacterized protein (TIGR02996 family)
MNDRLALLSAILAAPDDDLPRLVFADWLDENGTTDADAARAEFIRLGCKSKAKSRITSAETKWLDANWRRLLTHTVAARPSEAKPPKMAREGRFVRVSFRWMEPPLVRAPQLSFEYVRGFARSVCFRQGYAYTRFWRAAVTDEPLAYLRPEQRPAEEGNRMTGWYSRLLRSTWGDEVYRRCGGYDEESPTGDKVYDTWPQGTAAGVRGPLRDPRAVASFHPLVVTDEHGLDPASHRLRAAVATAMTALAREFVGLVPPAG